jgi:tRNA(Ile)-lysidine synthase
MSGLTGQPGHQTSQRGAAAAAAPIDAAAFAAAMAPFAIADGSKIAVAVSGGADSMALLLLLAEWSVPRNIVLTALTVDHRLRDRSADEATQAAAWCAARGVAHVILPWQEGMAQRGLARSPQSAARDARYRLLTDWCRDNGHGFLCVAHHADDQIETFLLRLARGSGVDGLAAMAAERVSGGIHILRPLLAFGKAALTATCCAADQPWIDDPSNRNRASARVRFREARAMLAAEGLDDDRLLATVGHMRRARVALEYSVDMLLAAACRWDAYGVARLAYQAFAAAPAEIALRALTRVLRVAAGAAYGPRYENLERLYDALMRGPWRDATLHGCCILRSDGDIVIFREAAAIGPDVALDTVSPVLWDGRFRVGIAADELRDGFVTAVTPAGWQCAGEASALPAIQPAVRAALPMIVDTDGVAAIPHVGFVRPDLARRLKTPIFLAFAPEAQAAAIPSDVAEMTPQRCD